MALVNGILSDAVGTCVGTSSYFVRLTQPAGWLECDGSFVSQTTYALLFERLGHMHNGGVDPGDNTFRLPSGRARTIRAVATNDGAIGGSEGIVLTVEQMAQHTHTIGNMSANASHAHTVVLNAGGEHAHMWEMRGYGATVDGMARNDYGGRVYRETWNANGGGAHYHNYYTDVKQLIHGHTIPTSGLGTAHNNMQSYLVLRQYIKAVN